MLLWWQFWLFIASVPILSLGKKLHTNLSKILANQLVVSIRLELIQYFGLYRDDNFWRFLILCANRDKSYIRTYPRHWQINLLSQLTTNRFNISSINIMTSFWVFITFVCPWKQQLQTKISKILADQLFVSIIFELIQYFWRYRDANFAGFLLLCVPENN